MGSARKSNQQHHSIAITPQWLQMHGAHENCIGPWFAGNNANEWLIDATPLMQQTLHKDCMTWKQCRNVQATHIMRPQLPPMLHQQRTENLGKQGNNSGPILWSHTWKCGSNNPWLEGNSWEESTKLSQHCFWSTCTSSPFFQTETEEWIHAKARVSHLHQFGHTEMIHASNDCHQPVCIAKGSP